MLTGEPINLKLCESTSKYLNQYLIILFLFSLHMAKSAFTQKKNSHRVFLNYHVICFIDDDDI